MKWVVFLTLLFSHALFCQQQITFLSTSVSPAPLPTETKEEFREVPFELINGMIFVEAQANNQSGFFILDTGAPMLVLNRSYQQHALPSRTAASCSGNFEIGESTVRHFQWAGMEKYELRVLTTDLSHLEVATGRPIMGLIGHNLFKDQELFIDYEQRRLILFAPERNPLHRALTPIYTAQLTMRDHLPVIEFSIGHKTLRFGLDTGSETNLIDHCIVATLDQALVETIEYKEMQGLDKHVRTVPVIRIAESYWNDLPMEQLDYLVTDLCHLKQERQPALDGLLGYNFFRPLKISINYRQKKFYLWQRSSSM